LELELPPSKKSKKFILLKKHIIIIIIIGFISGAKPTNAGCCIGGATPKFVGGPNPSLHLAPSFPLPFFPFSRFPPSP